MKIYMYTATQIFLINNKWINFLLNVIIFVAKHTFKNYFLDIILSFNNNFNKNVIMCNEILYCYLFNLMEVLNVLRPNNCI